MRFSLYYYTLGHSWNCERYLASGRKNVSEPHSAKGPFTHPRLLLAPPYWQSFYLVLFTHLTTATPMALVHTSDIVKFSGAETLSWLEGLQAGALIGSTQSVREMILLGTHTKLLQSLYYVGAGGSHIDQQTSSLFEEHGLKVNVSNIHPLQLSNR